MTIIRKHWTSILLLFVLTITIFFRFYGLKSFPPGLSWDEAINGNNALEAMETNRFRVWYPENYGVGGLFINVQALSVAVFGNEPWALRLVSAVFATLTVVGLFFLTRELFSDAVGLLASFFIAVSFWHVNFSRIGFEAISAPFFLVYGFYFLIKELRSLGAGRYRVNAALSGLFFGLGFYTYPTYWVLPLLLAIVVFSQWGRTDLHLRKSLASAVSICILMIFAVGLPLAVDVLLHPGEFSQRASAVSIFHRPVRESLRNVPLTLGMFHVRGDRNWRHNLAGKPLLWWPVGVLFLVGIGRAIYYARHDASGLRGYLPLAWFGVMLIPNLLSPEGTPHAVRALVVAPSVFIIAAIGAVWTGVELKGILIRNLSWTYANLLNGCLVGLFLGMHVVVTATSYISWANHPAVAEAFSANYAEEARILQALPAATPKYVIDNYGWTDVIVPRGPAAAQVLVFFTWHQKSLQFIREEELRTLEIPPGSILVPLQERKETRELIQARWPHAAVSKLKYFTSYRI